MNVPPIPNLQKTGGDGIRPVVARQRRELPMWLLGVFAVLGAVMLFGVLDSQRRAATAPTTIMRPGDAAPASPGLPPLYIPTDLSVPPPPPLPLVSPLAPASVPVPTSPLATAPPNPPAASPIIPRAIASSPVAPITEIAQRGDVLVFDGTGSREGGAAASDLAAVTAEGSAAQTALRSPAPSARARSTRLGQLATTVPQGTLIPAVLETALDSTRPGYVRALVSRDVRGFDGSQVLIPRGTRLFGEYQADLAPGQNRAFVRWTRLVRPDGVAIDLDSPAADALGRAGVQGRVNSHFLERFFSALLQTTVNAGVALASQSANNSAVVVALPGASQALTTPGPSQQIRPTLRVDAGAAVTVFVAQDLTFPGIERRR